MSENSQIRLKSKNILEGLKSVKPTKGDNLISQRKKFSCGYLVSDILLDTWFPMPIVINDKYESNER